MKKRKQMPSCDLRNYKSMSASISSLSDSFSNCSSKGNNWKRGISENGSIFYAKYTPKTQNHNCGSESTEHQSEPRRNFKLSSVNNEITKELYLTVSFLDRYRFGRRSSIVESLLGFEVIPFHDNIECLMVANIIDNCIKMEYPYIKEGDWFKSLENIEVRAGNIDMLLLQYSKATRVKLTFKGSCKQTLKEGDIIVREITSFEEFACTYNNSFNSKLEQEPLTFLTLIVSREYFKADANDDCIFYYPFVSNNFLYRAKGSFLTMDSVIQNDFKSKPVYSSIIVNFTKYYICYGYVNGTFIVCAFSSRFQSRKAAMSNGNDFINFLKFNISQDNMLTRNLSSVCDILKINIEKTIVNSSRNLYLGKCLSSSYCISLPKEAQLRICDALSELESMDCKKWSESEDTFHDVIICGSALFYKDCLLSSSLPVGLRIIVECFLRLRGIAKFLSAQDVREMYVWEKIELVNAKNEHFLAICIHSNLLLVVVLKSVLLPPMKPNIHSLTYMEEITDTISYLISCGIGSISEVWVDSSKRPSINLNKICSQVRHKFNFAHRKNFPFSDNSDSPPQNLFQNEEAYKKRSDPESSVDWQEFCNKNEFSGSDQQSSNDNGSLLNEIKNMIPLNLTAGWLNDLKYFLHFNLIDALILQPFIPMSSNLHLCIIKEYILEIHEILQKHVKKFQAAGLSLNRSQFFVKEHAISFDLLNMSGEKESFVLIGRLFSFPLKEVFVCFGQNISQSVIELSFRMSSLSIG